MIDKSLSSSHIPRLEVICGCLLGTAVGDAVGLPYEGISRRRQRKFLPPETPLRHRLLPGRRGMVSDDTEHTCLTAQALALSGGDGEVFQRELGRGFRWWIAGLPAGIGWATLRSGMKLWCGFSPARSGVFSAGNGPAMRAPILGAAWGHDPERLKELVRASTRMTHTDPKAEWGALAVAVAASIAAEAREETGADGKALGARYIQRVETLIGADGAELVDLLRRAVVSAAAGEDPERFADFLGLKRGISGYIFHTVPVAISAWLCHPHDYRAAVTAAVRCGGDTDTVAAVTGGIVGAGCGRDGIPRQWIEGLFEWPRTTAWMEVLAEVVARSVEGRKPVRPPAISWLATLPRNAFFLAVVLTHGVRRLLPPY